MAIVEELSSVSLSAPNYAYWTPAKFHEVRRSLSIAKVVFANVFGVEREDVDAWEEGTKPIPGPVVRLMSMFEKDPNLLKEHEIFWF